MDKKIEQALSYRKEGKLEESNQLLLELLKKKAEDSFLNYQVAWSLDLMGKESEAIHFYEEAIRLGLNEVDLEGAYLGLGSTYRSLGKYEEAEQVLTEGMKTFPKNNALKAFYGMVLYNLQHYSEGMSLLLQLLATTSNDEQLIEYKKAIMFYAENLDQTWEQ